MYPTIGDYNEVIDKRGGQAFDRLGKYIFKPSRLLPVKIYIHGTGAYAVVFKASDKQNEFAIKCFIGGDDRNAERYRQLDIYLSKINFPWLTQVNYLPEEISVNGNAYPVVKMPWIDGVLLNDFITINLQDNAVLSEIQEIIIQTSQSLEVNFVGHGDIQCGNMLVAKTSGHKVRLKLIDYDGMYIPTFKAKDNLEGGRAEFQHPKRSPEDYNEKIDRFSFLVIITALEALKYDKELWKEVLNGGFNTLDNMLFIREDFKDPHRSSLFKRLNEINRPAMQFYLIQLVKACTGLVSDILAPSLYDKNAGDDNRPIGFRERFNLEELQKLLLIKTIPPGAIVLADYKNIGITPCHIDKTLYTGQTIILTQGTHFKSFVVGEQNTVNFEMVANPDLEKRYQIHETSPKPTPPIPSAVYLVLNEDQSDSKHDNIGVFILIMIAFVIVIIIIVINKFTL